MTDFRRASTKVCLLFLFSYTVYVLRYFLTGLPLDSRNVRVRFHAEIGMRICPRGPNQVSDTFCFGSSLMDEIFICAIDQEGTGPKLSV